MKEAAVLIDLEGHPFYWHMPNDRSGAAIPDSRPLWDVIWENRARLSGIAHTHPGYDPKPMPSHEDLTTFAAIEAGLGKRLKWWLVTGYQSSIVTWQGRRGYVTGWAGSESWSRELLIRSGFAFIPKDEPADGDPLHHDSPAHGSMFCYGCGGFRAPNNVCPVRTCPSRFGSPV